MFNLEHVQHSNKNICSVFMCIYWWTHGLYCCRGEASLQRKKIRAGIWSNVLSVSVVQIWKKDLMQAHDLCAVYTVVFSNITLVVCQRPLTLSWFQAAILNIFRIVTHQMMWKQCDNVTGVSHGESWVSPESAAPFSFTALHNEFQFIV